MLFSARARTSSCVVETSLPFPSQHRRHGFDFTTAPRTRFQIVFVAVFYSGIAGRPEAWGNLEASSLGISALLHHGPTPKSSW